MQFDWKSYFIFTSKEQKGIVVLGGILSLSLLLHYLLPATSSNMDRFSNAKNKPKTLFYFDPNLLDSLQGFQLGLSSKQMTTLYHYREKGGRFKKKEDLYSFSTQQLIKWLKDNEVHYVSDIKDTLIDIVWTNLNEWEWEYYDEESSEEPPPEKQDEESEESEEESEKSLSSSSSGSRSGKAKYKK
jgi:hypothetical protein